MRILEDDIQLIHKYANKGIIPDTNVLMIYFIGTIDKKLIGTIKGTKEYNLEDFENISQLLSLFNKIVVTPNILTELYGLTHNDCKKIKDYSDNYSNIVNCFEELYIKSKDVIKNCYFKDIGLTDAGINLLSKQEYLVLTADFKLYGCLLKQKIDVINYNHFRQIK